jgi:hypothetical protein
MLISFFFSPWSWTRTRYIKVSCTHKNNRNIDLQMVPSRIYKGGDTTWTNMKQSLWCSASDKINIRNCISIIFWIFNTHIHSAYLCLQTWRASMKFSWKSLHLSPGPYYQAISRSHDHLSIKDHGSFYIKYWQKHLMNLSKMANILRHTTLLYKYDRVKLLQYKCFLSSLVG